MIRNVFILNIKNDPIIALNNTLEITTLLI